MCDIQKIKNNSTISGMDFTDCDMKGLVIADKTFTKCKFSKVNLTNAKLKNIKFIEVKFEGVKFVSAILEKVYFKKCIFSDLDFTDAKMRKMNFKKAVLNEDVVFKDAILTESNFEDANLYTADFEGALFNETNFDSATFVEANLKGVEAIDSSFKKADFNEANLIYANFESIEMTGAMFIKANLIEANLMGANLGGAFFRDADLTGANLLETDLTGARLTRAYLRGANLIGAILTSADLKNADLKGADLTDADLTGANLTDANLTDANLTGATIPNGVLSGAIGAVVNVRVNRPAYPTLINPSVDELSHSFKKIPVKQIASDIIDGDVVMTDFLTENLNSVAFFFQNYYYLIDKNELSKTISTGDEIKDMNNSIVFECYRANTMRPENIVSEKPLMKLGSIGLPVNYSYIPTGYIEDVVKNTSKKVNDRIYEIVKTTDTVKSVVSYQVLKGLTSAVSASHCQEGQGGSLFKLLKIKNAGRIVSDTIKRVATMKRSRRGGRKTRKNSRSRFHSRYVKVSATT